MARSRKATGVKARITAAQKSARRKNIAVARASKKRGRGKLSMSAKIGRNVFAKEYKTMRSMGASKKLAKKMGLDRASDVVPNWAGRKAKAMGFGKVKKYGGPSLGSY